MTFTFYAELRKWKNGLVLKIKSSFIQCIHTFEQKARLIRNFEYNLEQKLQSLALKDHF